MFQNKVSHRPPLTEMLENSPNLLNFVQGVQV